MPPEPMEEDDDTDDAEEDLCRSDGFFAAAAVGGWPFVLFDDAATALMRRWQLRWRRPTAIRWGRKEDAAELRNMVTLLLFTRHLLRDRYLQL